MKDNVYRIIKTTVIAVVLAFAIFTFATTSYGWLANIWGTNNGQSFVAGEKLPPDFKMWRGKTNPSTNKTTWTEIQNADATGAGDNQLYCVESVDVQEETNDKYTITINSLHFGTIDNVYKLKGENYAYLRFKINGKAQGFSHINITCKFRDKTQPTDYPFIIYATDTEDKTKFVEVSSTTQETVYGNIYKLTTGEEGASTLLRYAYTVTTTNTVPDEDNTIFKDIFDGNTTNFGTEVELTSLTAPKMNEGDYYLYLRLSPDPTTIGQMAKILNTYMPAIILFDLVISVEIY